MNIDKYPERVGSQKNMFRLNGHWDDGTLTTCIKNLDRQFATSDILAVPYPQLRHVNRETNKIQKDTYSTLKANNETFCLHSYL